jgi:hypothetical protein
MSTVSPRVWRTISTVRSMMESVRSPRKSILSKPASSSSRMGVLRDDFAAGGAAQRHVVAHIARGDHHAGGMDRDIAAEALQHQRELHQLAQLRVGALAQPLQVGKLQRLLQGRDLAQHNWDALRDGVERGHWDAQHTPHILDDGTAGERPKGDDLRYGALPVAPAHVVDDQVALVVAEVHINIGHGDPLWVQEALKEQIVAQRVQAGDAQGVGNQATDGGAAPGDRRARPMRRAAAMKSCTIRK